MTIIKSDCWSPGDMLRVTKIVTYNNMFNNGLEYAILYEHQDQDRYEKSHACSNVTTIWEI